MTVSTTKQSASNHKITSLLHDNFFFDDRNALSPKFSLLLKNDVDMFFSLNPISVNLDDIMSICFFESSKAYFKLEPIPLYEK